MARANFVKKARKDIEGTDIKKGDSYYWWKFRFGGKICSKTAPRQSQLTQSDFLSQIYGIQERIEDITTDDNFETEVEEIKSDLENLQSECEDRLGNMPDQLQSAPSGEMLQNRIDEIDSMMSELDGIDLEIDEMCIEEEVRENNPQAENMDELIQEAIEDRKQEILEEIQGVSYNGE